jgi:hypothetical protein
LTINKTWQKGGQRNRQTDQKRFLYFFDKSLFRERYISFVAFCERKVCDSTFKTVFFYHIQTKPLYKEFNKNLNTIPQNLFLQTWNYLAWIFSQSWVGAIDEWTSIWRR